MAKGNFIEYVVSDNPNKYPNNGEHGGYYYELFDESGQYVWKKYDKREFSGSVTADNTGFTLRLLGIDGDRAASLSFIDEDYLIGAVINLDVELTDVTLTLLSNNKVYCQSASIDSWSYSKNTRTITFISSDIAGVAISVLLKTANFNHFLSYVTAEDISKYPDGGTQDGYWYDKIYACLTLGMFGCTRIAVDKFIPSSDIVSSNATIPHSLGLIPKIGIVTGNPTHLAGNLESAFGCFNTDGSGYSIMIRQETTAHTAVSGSSSATKATVSTMILPHNTTWFKAGVEYTVITMA